MWNQVFAPNPLLLANPRVKKWVETLLAHKDPLERAAGFRLGPVLGCGHWGCVVDLVNSPWVLKLTVDPTEAHIWAKILELMKDERYGEDGFPRFKKLFRLDPGIPYGKQGRTKAAYGIVREKIAPVFSDARFGLELTDFTKQQLGLAHLTVNVPVRGKPGAWQAVPAPVLYDQLRSKSIVGLDQQAQYKSDEFVENIEMLVKYRFEARLWHKGDPMGSFLTREERSSRLERILNRMGGGIGGPLGESLQMLLSNNVVLNDVHQLNLGWRFLDEIEGVEGYPTLVVFDPGHTPTQKRQLPTESWVQLAAMG